MAIEVFPGREVLSFRDNHMARAQVLNRKVEMSREVIGLLLSNGQRLAGSRDQKVAVYRDKRAQFTELSNVEIGDRLRGEKAGMQVVVNVTGLMFYPRQEVRLVGFQIDHDKNFVAEGVLCR
jgi:hypothetical protein